MDVKYIDSFSNSTAHLQFNASFLTMISKLYDKVIYYSGRSSMKEVEELLRVNDIELKNIQKHNIIVISGNSRFSLFLRYLVSAFNNIIFLLFSKKNDILIYNYNNLFSLRLLNLLNAILNRKIMVCCHGELELLTDIQCNGGFLFKVLRLLIKDFFRHTIQDNIFFIVLGDIILKNLHYYLNEEQLNHFISIDHPYIFSEKIDIRTKSNFLNIGTVGVFSKSKGGDSLIELIENINNPNIKYSITGRILYDKRKIIKYKIDTIESAYKESIPQSIFMERISQLDYILFFYKQDSYRITASGAILDAINLRKPILAIKNEYFCYLFNKIGILGVLFDSVSEMSNYIKENGYKNLKYKSEDYDFKKIQYSLSPEHQADLLYKKLKILHLI